MEELKLFVNEKLLNYEFINWLEKQKIEKGKLSYNKYNLVISDHDYLLERYIDIVDEDGESDGGFSNFVGWVDETGKFYPGIEYDGYLYDWECLTEIFDPEIAEKLHNKLAPCTPQEFMNAYVQELKKQNKLHVWLSDEVLSQMRREKKEW